MQLVNNNFQAQNVITDDYDESDVEYFKSRAGDRAACCEVSNGVSSSPKLRGHTMSKMIYAIYDNVAHDIIGGLHLFPHHAPAIRMFGDIAALPNSSIGLHPRDFDLIRLGELTDDNTITPTKEIILTGETWSAAQKPQLEKEA